MEVNISQSQWEEAAKLLNLSVEETQKRYMAAIEQMGTEMVKIHHEALSAKSTDKDFSFPFDLSFYGIVTLKGELTITTGDNWAVIVKAAVALLGVTIINIDQTLDPSNPEFCFEVNAAVAKASICFGYKDSCIYIKGEACYWAFSWSCTDFEENLVCF